MKLSYEPIKKAIYLLHSRRHKIWDEGGCEHGRYNSYLVWDEVQCKTDIFFNITQPLIQRAS